MPDRPLNASGPAACLRLTVSRWSSDAVFGCAEGREGEVCVPLHDAEGRDWTYLLPMLEAGMRLHVVDGLLVLDPDYLVDISAVAACFEPYGESPLLHLLRRLRPAPSGDAVVLGSLAGQLLDEEVHAAAGQGAPRDYAEVVRSFFRTHAVALLAAPPGAAFHEQGRLQQANIRRAVRQTLPAAVSNFDAREVTLEPSFFSEMLGLQGRMDFLQLDLRLLIEQKAGKGAFPQPDPDTPVAQLKHAVQLLLYMTLLRYNHGARGLQAFLLYSRYANALQPVAFSRDLLFRALRVRNGIAHAERQWARGRLESLTSLTPDHLNPRGLKGRLWQLYVRPQLDALLAPLRTCSALERAYYLRLLAFVAAEHRHAKVGSGTPSDAGFAAKWRQPLAEKAEAGDILLGLRLLEPRPDDEGRVDAVALTLPADVGNFRVGDIVILYAYAPGTPPDACATMVMRSSIARMEGGRLSLLLRAPQTDAHVFRRQAGSLWAVEHDFMESSFAPLYRGLHAFLSAPRERRDLLLLQRPPRVDGRQGLRLAHGPFGELALRVRQAADLFLIVGPPGTGKTSYGLMTALREELADPAASVLLLSYTNRAVDEMCSKLDLAGIGFLRIGSRLSCDKAFADRLLDEQVAACTSLASLRHIVVQARVVVATVATLSAHIGLLGLRDFSLAIADEASQMLEPHLLGILSAQYEGRPSVGRLVMIGDHKQLPAVVQQPPEQSKVDEASLQAIGLTDCSLSLFERMLRAYGDDPRLTFRLTRQGRMHPDVARFPNEAFYGGQLSAVPLPHQQAPLRPGAWPRLMFIDVPAPPAPPPGNANPAEADAVARIADALLRRLPQGSSPAQALGIIVPYRAQIAAIRERLAGLSGPGPWQQVDTDTVERFQGSQRDNIIYGFTASRPAQLDFLTRHAFEEEGRVVDRRLNVAMTRARERLILVGDASLLSQNALFASLIRFVGATPWPQARAMLDAPPAAGAEG